jgi:hypothetical protein
MEKPNAVASNLQHLPPACYDCVSVNYSARFPTWVGPAQVKSYGQLLISLPVFITTTTTTTTTCFGLRTSSGGTNVEYTIENVAKLCKILISVFYICYRYMFIYTSSVVRVPGYTSGGPGFDSRALQEKK